MDKKAPKAKAANRAKPLNLSGVKFEDAMRALLATPPIKKDKPKRGKV